MVKSYGQSYLALVIENSKLTSDIDAFVGYITLKFSRILAGSGSNSIPISRVLNLFRMNLLSFFFFFFF